MHHTQMLPPPIYLFCYEIVSIIRRGGNRMTEPLLKLVSEELRNRPHPRERKKYRAKQRPLNCTTHLFPFRMLLYNPFHFRMLCLVFPCGDFVTCVCRSCASISPGRDRICDPPDSEANLLPLPYLLLDLNRDTKLAPQKCRPDPPNTAGGVRSAEGGVRRAECGVRSAECGVRSAVPGQHPSLSRKLRQTQTRKKNPYNRERRCVVRGGTLFRLRSSKSSCWAAWATADTGRRPKGIE